MRYGQLARLIASDIHRYYGRCTASVVLRCVLFGVGEKYSIWLRLTRFFRERGPSHFPLFVLCRLVMRHYAFKFGIDVPRMLRSARACT
jgi:hypothetical protein